MGDIFSYLTQGQRSLKNAKQILAVSYPLTSDPKLFASVVDRLYNCWINGIHVLCLHEGLTKDLNAEIGFFREDFSQKVPLPRQWMRTFDAIVATRNARAESPVEFRRKQTFVICSPAFRARRLDLSRVQQYLQDTERFVKLVEEKVRQ